LKLFANSKQWYESLDRSDIVFQVGNSSSRVFDSANSKHYRMASDTQQNQCADSIKVRELQTMQVSNQPTNDTFKN